MTPVAPVAWTFMEMAERAFRESDELHAEIERLNAKIAYVRQRSQRACEILNEFDATEPMTREPTSDLVVEPKPIAENEELRAEVERLKADAERLRVARIKLFNWLNTHYPHVAIAWARRPANMPQHARPDD